ACAGLAALMLGVAPATVEAAATVNVTQSDEHGQYLTDAEGRALYLFTADTQGGATSEPQVNCEGECLQAWPPLHTDGEPQAGDMADASKLATIDHDGQMMVTYNGWPLYYFEQDQRPGQTEGQDVEGFGGEWYLVTPEGERVSEETGQSQKGESS